MSDPKKVPFKSIPVGIKIAAAAVAKQNNLTAQEYRMLCQKLLRETVQSQTHGLDKYFGSSAKSTASNFKKAGIGEKYRDPSQLRPGDLAYSDEGSKQYGHAMLVGPEGRLYDQAGSGSPQKAGFRHPSWIVHPDSAISAYNKARDSGSTHSQASKLAVPSRSTKTSDPSPLPTPIPGADKAQVAFGTSPRSGIRQYDVDQAALAMAAPTSTPYAVPHQDIPFPAPPPMPNNIPSAPSSTPPAIPGGYPTTSFSYAPPNPTAPPAPQYGQGSAEGGYEIGGGYGAPYYLGPAQDTSFNIPMDYGYDFSAVPDSSYVPTADVNLASTYQVENLGGEQSGMNEGGTDIANFGGDMSLGGDLESADYAYMGMPGDYGSQDESASDFYVANDQYGEGGWYYDEQGDIVPHDDPAEQPGTASQASQQPAQRQAAPSDSGLQGQTFYRTPFGIASSAGINVQGVNVQPGGGGSYQLNVPHSLSGAGSGTVSNIQSILAGPQTYAGIGPQTVPTGGLYAGLGSQAIVDPSTGFATGAMRTVGESMHPFDVSSPGPWMQHWSPAVGESSGTMEESKARKELASYGGDEEAMAAAHAANDSQRQSILDSLGDPTGWQFNSNSIGGTMGGKRGFDPWARHDTSLGATVAGGHGGWTPVWSPTQIATLKSVGFNQNYVPAGMAKPTGAPSQVGGSFLPFTASPPAPLQPTELAGGGAIDAVQWMKSKSGKVPGVDHGVDEIHSLLEPGEVVVNEGQMAGLSIKNPKLLRADQRKAIKAAHKRKKAA